MPIASIRRRLGKLEIDPQFMVRVDYPPFSPAEIVDIGNCIREGKRLTMEETARLRSHSPLIEGSLMIVANHKGVSAKRYGDLDLAEL